MNKIAYMTCVLSLAFTMQACDDFLDSFPQDTVTNENFLEKYDSHNSILAQKNETGLPQRRQVGPEIKGSTV